ncbi:MAG: hypothetical protein IT381_13180 [Deltaproteobacteria bacterium]|nr:hypothetical protein [Deltaproteobacteria bacterium]
MKFPSREPFTTADGAYAWTGAYANTPGLLALVFASTTDANASTRRVLLLDVVTEATRWLVFPTPAGPSRDAGVHRLMFAPDGTRLVISGDHRYDVFSRDGAWLAGESALPEGCGVIQDVVIDAAHRLRVRLAR